MKIRDRLETIELPGLQERFRILQISDVHFSKSTSHEKNQQITVQILKIARQYHMPHLPVRMIAVTGDLVSRKPGENGIPDAVRMMQTLGRIAPVVFSLGNHESDLSEENRGALLGGLQDAGVTVLDNASTEIDGVHVTGLTLPQEVFRRGNGLLRFLRLQPITAEMTERCIGSCSAHPQILLAHSPIGFPAYAQWGADVVLSGHVHGGIVRIPKLGGILSPERRFLPRFTKGKYEEQGCWMEVSAGIGKLRINNPAEVVCVDLVPGMQEGIM